jgi:hypothetical protein
MNTSAKITTGTFLAAMALGAASLIACTVNSTSSTDTDGGTSSSGGSSGTTSSSGGSSGTTSDAGEDGGTCDSTSQTTKYPAACQACTETNCCDKIGACFGQDPGDAGVGCNDYAECVSTCEEGTDDTCIETQCDAIVAPAVKTAFDILQQCQLSNCETECFQ